MPRVTRILIVILLCAALAAVPLVVQGYPLFILTLICNYVIVAVGLNILCGSAGLVSFGHAGFYAIGAYGAAVLGAVLGWPFIVDFILAAMLSGVVGALVAIPALRLKKLSLAITTFGFGIVAQTAIIALRGITGGVNGLSVPPVELPGSSSVDLYLLNLGAALAVILICSNLARSKVGRAWASIRGSEVAASAVGINVTYYKVMAFVVSAVTAGIAGVLYGQTTQYLSPDSFDSTLSISFFAMIVIGGLRSVAGAVLGATFFVLLPEVLSDMKDTQAIIFGLLIILSVMFIAGWPGRRLHQSHPCGAPPSRSGVAACRHNRQGAGMTIVASQPDEAGLVVQGLSKAFGGLKALDNVSFQVRPRSIHSLIGPNGAGKTTVFNCITNVYTPDRGDIRLDAATLLSLRPHKLAARGIARTFQNLELFGDMSVLDNVLTGSDFRLPESFLESALHIGRARRMPKEWPKWPRRLSTSCGC